MYTPFELILIERTKQVAKGFDASHDDSHDRGELARAAACYLAVAAGQARGLSLSDFPVEKFDGFHDSIPRWPWDPESLRPDQFAIENLVKAGALIVAEMERLQRTVSAQRYGEKKGYR